MLEKEKKKLSRKEVKIQLNKLIELFQKKTTKTLRDKIKAESKLKAENNLAGKKPLKENINSLQETIDYLRVCVIYTLLDLEANRREQIALKKLLKDNGIDV